jgi:hypothetical protein
MTTQMTTPPPPPDPRNWPEEPTWENGEPRWWWLTKRYLRMSPGRVRGGRRKYTALKHTGTPEPEDD